MLSSCTLSRIKQQGGTCEELLRPSGTWPGCPGAGPLQQHQDLPWGAPQHTRALARLILKSHAANVKLT